MRLCVPICGDTCFELITSVISAKGNENPPSIKKPFCDRIEKTEQEAFCLRFLLDVFSSFQSQVLGWIFIAAYGEASGFFCFWALPHA